MRNLQKAISLEASSDILLDGNDISNVLGRGIDITSCTGALVISDNVISMDSGEGVLMDTTFPDDHGTVHGNSVKGGNIGMRFSGCGGMVVSGNAISSCSEASFHISSSTDLTFNSNELNQGGFHVQSSKLSGPIVTISSNNTLFGRPVRSIWGVKDQVGTMDLGEVGQLLIVGSEGISIANATIHGSESDGVQVIACRDVGI